MTIKTAMQYENGKLIHIQKPDSNNPSQTMPIMSITGAIDLCIQQFVTEKITGVLYVEIRDIRKDPNNVTIDFDIEPKTAISQVERAVDLFHKNRRRPDRPNSDQKK